MKIMKTNMLLLDNKMNKEMAEQNKISAKEAVNVQKSGMNALMFQGMQNVMANPMLAAKLGVTNDDTVIVNPEENPVDAENANASNGNVSFKGGKFKTLALGAMLAATTLGGLTSCVDVDSKTSQSVEVEFDTSVIESLLQKQNDVSVQMQAALTQLLLQDQINAEQYNKYMNDMSAWRQSMSKDINSIMSVLNVIATNTFDLKDGQSAIYDANNANHKNLIDYLSRFMDRDEAIKLFNQMFAEVATGNKTAAEAYATLIGQVGTVIENQNIMIQQNKEAAEQRNTEIGLLKNILLTGEATKEGVDALNTSLKKTNKLLSENACKFMNQLKQIDKDIKASDKHNTDAIAALAQQNKCSKEEILCALNNLGIKIDNGTKAQYWTAGMLAGALEGIDASINKQTGVIQGFKNDFDSYATTAIQYADATLNEIQGVNGRLGTFMGMFAQHANNVDAHLSNLECGVSYANMSLSYIAQNVGAIREGQEKTNGLLCVISSDVKSIDRNVVKTREDLANAIGVSTAIIDQRLQWLGYDINKVQTWNADKIINAFENAIDEQNCIINYNGQKIDKLTNVVKGISCEIGSVGNTVVNAVNNFNKTMEGLKVDMSTVNSNTTKLVEQNQKAIEQREAMENGINTIADLVAKLKLCECGDSDAMTAAQFKQILKDQSQEDYNFYANLLKNYEIPEFEFDSQPIENLLKEISCKMEYQKRGNETLQNIYNLMLQFPDKADEIKQAINDKQFVFNCCCQEDCDHNDKVHEGIRDDLGLS